MHLLKLGILGGGQLGRMSALAAARLGIRTAIFTPELNSPASFVCDQTIIADYSDHAALAEFAGDVDVITYEFENIPLDTIHFLKAFKPVYPDESLLKIAQDRIEEKNFLNAAGIPTARFYEPKSTDDLRIMMREWNVSSCIIKTTRFGYDGKGQWRITRDSDIETVWSQISNSRVIMEEIIHFSQEISVVVARDLSGEAVTYGPMHNEHENHILARTSMPTNLPEHLTKDAIDKTCALAEKLNLRGVLALEMFVTPDGQILANEIAPRTHNSGHWSIDACAVSQFENHVRAVCGLPLGRPARHSDARMINILGEDALSAAEYLKQENACLHLYGKQEWKPGRKMGHVTFLKTLTGDKR